MMTSTSGTGGGETQLSLKNYTPAGAGTPLINDDQTIICASNMNAAAATRTTFSFSPVGYVFRPGQTLFAYLAELAGTTNTTAQWSLVLAEF